LANTPFPSLDPPKTVCLQHCFPPTRITREPLFALPHNRPFPPPPPPNPPRLPARNINPRSFLTHTNRFFPGLCASFCSRWHYGRMSPPHLFYELVPPPPFPADGVVSLPFFSGSQNTHAFTHALVPHQGPGSDGLSFILSVQLTFFLVDR